MVDVATDVEVDEGNLDRKLTHTKGTILILVCPLMVASHISYTWDPKTYISLIAAPKHKFLFPFPQPKEEPMWRLDKNALIPKYMAGNWDSCADT